ncbi:hypothetical protein J5N97_022888 [Dioscorea zingiberensis]|uniref:BHLH domain-containing protein n=1 Tax=Dioscorea zingiberensis TaxID=325984 RepID=A0A9D5CAZ2_9LILI|nr:hypothetical protein J5N97_022888 [Dioscorea zingiberensis]
MGLFHEQPEIYDELVSFCESFDEPDNHLPVLNSIFDQPGDISSTTHQTLTLLISNQQLPYSHSTPCNEFNVYKSPQRLKKNYGNNVVYDPSNNFMYDYSNVICKIPDPAHEFFMDYFVPPAPWAAEDLRPTENCSKFSNRSCLSTQSMAARQRRKRISDKTQELGRLIPEGNKMNTAEMLQAAFKYVKFLQAQVGILGIFMNSTDQEYRGVIQGDQEHEMQMLLESPKVHEKLYIEGKCIVLEKMVENLLEDKQINLNRSVHRDLARFVETIYSTIKRV